MDLVRKLFGAHASLKRLKLDVGAMRIGAAHVQDIVALEAVITSEGIAAKGMQEIPQVWNIGCIRPGSANQHFLLAHGDHLECASY